MSGERSISGLIVETDRLAMSADRPVSALQTLRVRDSLQHLVDVSVQQRVNWVASTSSSEYGGGGEIPTNRTQYGWLFPVTITAENRMPSFDVRIGVRLTGTLTGGVMTTALNATGWIPNPSTNKSIRAAFPETISAAASTWYDYDAVTTVGWKQWRTSINYSEDLGSVNVNATTPRGYMLMKLEVFTTADDFTDGSMQIVGVHVREYLMP